MKEVEETVWINGRCCPIGQASWPVADRGLSLGDGLFETLRLNVGVPRHFDDHWQRLKSSAKALGFGDIGPGSEVLSAIKEVAKRNLLTQASARIVLSRGSGARGLAPPREPNCNWLIRTFAATEAPLSPLKLALSSVRRCASNPVSGHKTLSHLDMVMSRNWLVSGAKGNESLVLDVMGNLCCVGIGNLFWLRGNTVYTPSNDCAILPGTTRARLLRIIRSVGLQVKIGVFAPEVLQSAEAVFISNALIGVRMAQQVDLGNGLVSHYATESRIVTELAASEA